jgi:hypothetical protein
MESLTKAYKLYVSLHTWLSFPKVSAANFFCMELLLLTLAVTVLHQLFAGIIGSSVN